MCFMFTVPLIPTLNAKAYVAILMIKEWKIKHYKRTQDVHTTKESLI